jgi:alpha-tubulin suppressor-like RCC1 family protein
VATTSGGDVFGCAVTAANVSYCWGGNSYGQEGTGASHAFDSLPQPVSGGLAWARIDGDPRLNSDHACGVTTSGEGYCWGGPNTYGKLGLGAASDSSSTPQAVAGGISWQNILPASSYTCGLSTSGAAYCWGGTNSSGNLGTYDVSDPLYSEFHYAPTPVAGGHSFTQIAPNGSVFTCGLDTGGYIWCWGKTFAWKSGGGGTVYTPELIDSTQSFSSITVGDVFVCGVSGGALYCRGDENYFGVGVGTSTYAYDWVAVPVPGTVAEVHTAGTATCARNTSGAIYCWGNQYQGGLSALGSGSRVLTPTLVSNGITFDAFALGQSHALARESGTGTLYCWGNGNGCGLGTNPDSPYNYGVVTTPTKVRPPA